MDARDDAPALETLAHSNSEIFVVDVKLADSTSDSAAQPQAEPDDSSTKSDSDSSDADDSKPVIGKNEYVVRLVHANDLSPISKDTTVTVDYTHLHAKIPETYHATVDAQDDGSYLVTVYFEKPGTWNLDIHVSEPQSGSSSPLEDDYTLSVKL